MQPKVYDYIIIGAGAAGLHLAIAMCDDDYFTDKSIAILEKSSKDKNDRTWCFWEKGIGTWDKIVSAEWSNGKFITSKIEVDLDMAGFSYKMIKGIDFYNYAKKIISNHDNVDWIKCEVENIIQNHPNEVITDIGAFRGHRIFDSRIDKDFFKSNDSNSINLLQHFKGLFIETQENTFDTSSFVMMDYRISYPGTTSFIYVLPFSSNSALVEFTFFSPKLVEKSVYDEYIEKYIKETLEVNDYSVTDTEEGIIPMSNYPFHHLNSESLTKIGTAGSWVKPSTGYSFKNANNYSLKVVENIKKGKKPSDGLINRKFRMYDSIFLDVLKKHNPEGAELFSRMYSKNSAELIFKFLDEKTNFWEDLKVMNSFQLKPFAKAFFRHLF